MSTIKEFFICLFKKSRTGYKIDISKQTGFILDENMPKDSNNRLIGLFMRFVTVMLITAGTIEGFMSVFNIPYNAAAVLSVLAAVNLFLMLIQLNDFARLGGYLLCIWGVADFYSKNIPLLRSGINAVTNLCYELIRIKYKLPSVDGFDEIITDRSLTIPTLVITGGILFMILIWEICGRHINLALTAAVPFIVISTGLFFDGKPDMLSVVFLCTGWLAAAGIKLCGKSVFCFPQKKQYKIYIHKKQHYYHRQLNGRAAMQFIAFLMIISTILINVSSNVITKDTFDRIMPESQLKEFSDFMVKDAMILAFSKYKNYTVQGAISSGQLGQYSSVHPDHLPDLEITYVPSKLSREYLRAFIGTDYSSNGWTSPESIVNRDIANMTARAAADEGLPPHKMVIKSLDLISDKALLPYYTDLDSNSNIIYKNDTCIDMDITHDTTYELKYYDIPKEPVNDLQYRDYAHFLYTAVPDENQGLLADLCKKQGFSADDPDLVQKLASFFQDNYKYTLDPGLIPWKTDFVNYFLFEHKEGLCAHFATAGTLIYRTLGIPARYVEGYVIDYPLERSDQTVLEHEDIKNWYTGTDALSPHPVTITLSDFKAHAWVEVYRDGYGWVPVELTPIDFSKDYEKKESDYAVADTLAKLMFANSENDDTQKYTVITGEQAAEFTGYVLFAAALIFIAVIFAVLLKTMLRHALRLYRFSKRDAAAVTALYSYTADILSSLDKLENTSFKAADKALSAYMRSPEAVTDIVQQILYSPEPPDKTECENAFISLHTALEKIFANCSLSQKIKIIFKI